MGRVVRRPGVPRARGRLGRGGLTTRPQRPPGRLIRGFRRLARLPTRSRAGAGTRLPPHGCPQPRDERHGRARVPGARVRPPREGSTPPLVPDGLASRASPVPRPQALLPGSTRPRNRIDTATSNSVLNVIAVWGCRGRCLHVGAADRSGSICRPGRVRLSVRESMSGAGHRCCRDRE
jgi:hypothetical protein